MAIRKQQHHEAIRARAARAIANLYHNATPTYPRLDDADARRFESWFRDYAEQEIDYIKDGGATPGDYRETLKHPANGGRFKTEAARAFYVRHGMRKRDEERADCGMLTGWRVLELAAGNKALARTVAKLERKHGKLSRNNALWERISEWGTLYQYGRGGRTLAPDGLVKTRGGSSFSLDEDCAHEGNVSACVDLIRVLESFNEYVEQWNKGIAETWDEEEREARREARRQQREASAARKREREERAHWNARGVITR